MMEDSQIILAFARALIGFVAGLIFGSFITALSYRLPRGQSMIKPRSSCPSCNTVLGVRDLVPVFSWIFSGGKCRYCGTLIGRRYLLIELLSGILCAVAFAAYGWQISLILAVGVIMICLSSAVIDLEDAQPSRSLYLALLLLTVLHLLFVSVPPQDRIVSAGICVAIGIAAAFGLMAGGDRRNWFNIGLMALGIAWNIPSGLRHWLIIFLLCVAASFLAQRANIITRVYVTACLAFAWMISVSGVRVFLGE